MKCTVKKQHTVVFSLILHNKARLLINFRLAILRVCDSPGASLSDTVHLKIKCAVVIIGFCKIDIVSGITGYGLAGKQFLNFQSG